MGVISEAVRRIVEGPSGIASGSNQKGRAHQDGFNLSGRGLEAAEASFLEQSDLLRGPIKAADLDGDARATTRTDSSPAASTSDPQAGGVHWEPDANGRSLTTGGT